MDRWCTSCNTYQAALMCKRCRKPTEALVVWSPGTPKVRCHCRAPFEGLHLATEVNVPLQIGWRGTLEENLLTVDIELRSGGKVIELGSGKATPKQALKCPHCTREMLLARTVNFTKYEVSTKLELHARPDGAVILWATATRGAIQPGAS